MNTSSGIYKWTNLVTGQVLIGQTSNFATRKRLYLQKLRKGIYGNTHFQNSWIKYGEANFSFEIIEHIQDISLLTQSEQGWLDHYLYLGTKCFNKQGPVDCPNRGDRLSVETRMKMSKARMGKPANNKGVAHSQDTIEKIRSSKQALSLETKTKMSASARARSCNRKGVKLSEETKLKMAASQRARYQRMSHG